MNGKTRQIPCLFVLGAALSLSGCVITEKSEAPEKLAAPEKSGAIEAPVGTPADFSSAQAPIGAAPKPTASEARVEPAIEQAANPQGEPDGMAFGLGRSLAERTIQSAWKSVSPDGDCAAVPHLAAVVARTSGRVLASAESLQQAEKIEYAQGYIVGMRSQLAEIAAACSAQCQSLCDVANTAGKNVLCKVAKETGADVALDHPERMPSPKCEAGGCVLTPEKVSVADCP